MRGLSYNVSISEQTNETKCFQLLPTDTCYRDMQYGVLPNLLGETNAATDQVVSGLFKEIKYDLSCYKHKVELFCYMRLPKCDPVSKKIIPPCAEMCYDYLNGCQPHDSLFKTENCDYLPSWKGDVPCFYEPILYNVPTRVRNAYFVISYIRKGEHYLPITAQYACNKKFQLMGNKSVMCMYNGQWSTPPYCVHVPKNITPPTTELKSTTTSMESTSKYILESATDTKSITKSSTDSIAKTTEKIQNTI